MRENFPVRDMKSGEVYVFLTGTCADVRGCRKAAVKRRERIFPLSETGRLYRRHPMDGCRKRGGRAFQAFRSEEVSVRYFRFQQFVEEEDAVRGGLRQGVSVRGGLSEVGPGRGAVMADRTAERISLPYRLMDGAQSGGRKQRGTAVGGSAAGIRTVVPSRLPPKAFGLPYKHLKILWL